jgi:hypothetical protein
MHPEIQNNITFGPFRMAHLEELVDERFRRAFYCYLTQQVMPLLDGQVTRIDGRIFSHYDQPQFAAMAEVRSRFYYEISFSSAEGVEEAWGELDDNPVGSTWTPSKVKPPSVRTLTEKRKLDELEQAMVQSKACSIPRPTDCPHCHSQCVAEILYGLPADIQSLQADLDAGQLYLGGCFFSEDSPQWRCVACGHKWGTTAFALALRDIRARANRRDSDRRK